MQTYTYRSKWLHKGR